MKFSSQWLVHNVNNIFSAQKQDLGLVICLSGSMHTYHMQDAGSETKQTTNTGIISCDVEKSRSKVH